MKLVYLASAYAAEDPKVRQARYELVIHVAGEIMDQQEIMVYSPIVHNHPIAVRQRHFEILGRANLDPHDFWLPRDFEVLSRCDELWVLQSEGWTMSRGIKAETEFAEKTANKPIIYLDPKCRDCRSPQTCYRPCPYIQETCGDRILIWLCGDCYQDRTKKVYK